nr:ABC transporter ATP-binding protein [Lolliginicoccus levis]
MATTQHDTQPAPAASLAETEAPSETEPAHRGESRLLARALSRHRRPLVGATVLVSLHQAAEAAVPIAIGIIVDRAIASGDLRFLVLALAALAALFLVLTYSWRFGARIVVAAVQRESHALRVEVAGRILDPRGIRAPLKAGELTTISTTDADNTAWFLDLIPRAVAALTALAIISVALLVTTLPLGLIVLLGTPAIMGLVQLGSPALIRRTEQQQDSVGQATSTATDVVTGMRPLRGIGAEASATALFDRRSQAALSARLRAARAHSLVTALGVTASALLAVGVVGGAGWMALTGTLTPGELIIVAGLAQFLLEPLGLLASIPPMLAAARGSARRIALVLDAPFDSAPGPGSAPPPSGTSLELRGVSHQGLSGIDLAIGAGEHVAVFAHDPGDADALATVLASHAPERGTVLIDGTDISQLGLARARSALLVEPHHTELFAGTIGDNITLGQAGSDLDRVLAASAAADVVAAHPDGLDHAVADRGATLSGGQRQRLALARALHAVPPILVLHDPTTAVDAVTEQSIATGIRALRAGRTTVTITRSPALLAAADRVVALQDGQVASSATHAWLMEHDPAYRAEVAR